MENVNSWDEQVSSSAATWYVWFVLFIWHFLLQFADFKSSKLLIDYNVKEAAKFGLILKG